MKPISQWTDGDVEAEIIRVRTATRHWAEGQDLWHDSGFKSELEHLNCEPSEEPVVTLFHAETAIRHITETDLEPAFTQSMDDMGYYYEQVACPSGSGLLQPFKRQVSPLAERQVVAALCPTAGHAAVHRTRLIQQAKPTVAGGRAG